MATYTPNFNLSKPDASDPFGAFRQSYNDNMDIIDQNLGGGGGTTTDLFSILDSLRLSQRYNSGTLAGGEFTFSIDESANDWSSNVTATNTVAVDLTDYDTLRLTIEISDRSDYGHFWVTLSQTAYTWADYQWCSVYANENSDLMIDTSGTYDLDVSLLSGNYYIYIGATTGKDSASAGNCTDSHNGKIVGKVTSFVAVESASSIIPNPAGTPTDDLTSIEINGTIYAIAGGGGYSVKYSLTEREVGEWVDGRAVFEKTFDLTSLSCASQTWTDTGVSKGAIGLILHAQVFADDGTFYNTADVNITTNTDHIGIYNETGASITVRYIVLQYVKAHNLHLIEYIEGTGTQWLTTGIQPDLTTVLKAGIMPTENTGEVLLGNCADDNHDWRLFNYSGSFYYDFNDARWNGDSFSQNVYADIELGNYYAKKNGVTLFSWSPQTNLGTWSSNDIYFLYKQDNQQISRARLYYLKIYKSGNLVFDAVPVKDSNDVPCLFDFISGTYIYNSGTGDFVAGGDV